MDGKASDVATLGQYFGDLDDPRVARTRVHKFIDILVIGICTVICGGDDYASMEAFGKAKEAWLCTILELPNGIPAHDTFWRVFSALDPEQFQACFLEWMAAISDLTGGEIIALDGKQLRRSHDQSNGKAAIHMVSAWATTNRLVLGQVKVDEKSNEIKAIPERLGRLDLQGCLVTIDAMGCQTDIADLIVAQEGDYLFSLKGNQSNLHEDVVLLFDDLEESDYSAYAYDYAKTVDKDHGRIEVRHCWTISDSALIQHLRGAERFPALRTLVRLRSERYLGDEHSVEDRHFIGSATAQAADALKATRTLWQVENSLHWVLDIAFREDESRLHKGNGPQNFAVLPHIALNALKQETSAKLGVKNKRLKAGWDEAYLLKVLGHIAN
ncbi:MAG TPA: ISAs1 family transposase [Caldilineaceae bacterium]|nr:ISAs1 family transposase [Caldilineaceae bacterium]